MSVFLKILIFTLSTTGAWASSGITYHGRILKSDSTPITSATTQFRIQIRTPGTENCLLWEEQQTHDLTNTNGTFAITIADSSAPLMIANMLPYPLERVFSNRSNYTGLTNCAVGTSYNPSTADGRHLQVFFREVATNPWEQMPVSKINFVPIALNSVQLEGYQANEFLKIASTAVYSPLTAANVTTLLDIIAGTNAQYITPSTAFVGDVTGTSSTTSVNRIRGVNVVATAPNLNQVLKYDGTNWVPSTDVTGAAPGDASYAAKGIVQIDANLATSGLAITTGVLSLPNVVLAGGPIGSTSVTPVITYDAKGRLTAVTSATINDASKLPFLGGTMTGSIDMGTFNITNATSFASTNVSTRNLLLSDNDTNNVTIKAPVDITPANYVLTLPATAGAAGNVLSTNGAGILSWINPTNGTVTNVTSANSYITVGTGTTTPLITAVIGQVANTLAAGDDNRIVNAVQLADYNSDVLPAASCTATQTAYWSSGLGTWACQNISFGASGFFADGGNTVTAPATLGTNSAHALEFETGGTTKMTILNNGNVGIGTTNPSWPLQIVKADSTNILEIINSSSTASRFPGVNINNYMGTFGGTPKVSLYNNRGSAAAPATLTAGDQLGIIEFYGAHDVFGGSARGAQIRAVAEENFSASLNGGTYLTFSTANLGSAGDTEKMRISANGNMGIGTAGTPTAKLEVAGQIKITGGVPGVGKVLQSDATGLASWATLGGSESTAVSNVGTAGVGVYKQMTGSTIELKNISAATSAITITNDAVANEIDIGVNAELAGLSGLAANGFVKRTAAGTYSSVTALDLTTDVTGTLPIANGGTGQITANAALNALLPAQVTHAGKFLYTNATTTSWVEGILNSDYNADVLPAGSCTTVQTPYYNTTTGFWACQNINFGAAAPTLSSLTAATAANSINNGDFAQSWNWSLTTAAQSAFKITENTASINGAGAQYLVDIGTIAASTASPLRIQARGIDVINVSNSGALNINSNAAIGTTVGQNINITSGAALPLYKAGDITIKGGSGAAGGGNSVVTLQGSDGSSAVAGAVYLKGGNAGAAGTSTGGLAYVQGGTANATAGSSGGGVSITGANGFTGGNGGAIALSSGVGGNASFGNGLPAGNITIAAGAGGSSTSSFVGAAGALINITAGNGGAGNGTGAGGVGGNLTLSAGNAGAIGNVNGGDIVLNGGTKTGTGADGRVVLATLRGNVGIGTATPDVAAKLEVAGQVKITGGVPGLGKVLTSDAVGLAAWQAPSGTGITNLNTLTAGTQTFAIGAAGTAPAFSSAVSTHTLDIPLASGALVTSGTISKADYDKFNNETTISGSSGGIPYYNSATTQASSGLLTANGVLLGGGLGASPTSTGAGAANMVLRIPAGGGAPAFGTIDLATATSGILPIANGGTNSATALTGSKVMVSSGTAIVEGMASATAKTANTFVMRDGAGGVTGGLGTFDQFALNGSVAGVLNVYVPSSFTSWSITLPSTAGTAGQVLSTNGAGVTSWVAAPTSATSFMQDGNSFTADGTLGTNDAFGLNFETSGLPRMTVLAGGNVGIGTATPGASTKLRVSGQIAPTSGSIVTGAVDFTLGNAITTSFDCATSITLANIRDGGAYTVAITGTGTAQCNFSTITSGDDAATVTYRFVPANAVRTASSHTLYSLQRIGTVVYVSWITGF